MGWGGWKNDGGSFGFDCNFGLLSLLLLLAVLLGQDVFGFSPLLLREGDGLGVFGKGGQPGWEIDEFVVLGGFSLD